MSNGHPEYKICLQC